MSLYNTSAATLVHTCVTSCVDCCNAVYTGALKTVTDKLQQVLHAAVRVVCDIQRFDRSLMSLLHDEVHWLHVPERVTCMVVVMVYCCLHRQVPWYFTDHVITSFGVTSRLCLRSAN